MCNEYDDRLVSGDGITDNEFPIIQSIKTTCVNCKHYCSEICSVDDSFWHQHDYCTLWNNPIPKFVGESRLDYDIDDNREDWIYDDIETGLAYCHGFEFRTDGKFTNVFKTNERK